MRQARSRDGSSTNPGTSALLRAAFGLVVLVGATPALLAASAPPAQAQGNAVGGLGREYHLDRDGDGTTDVLLVYGRYTDDVLFGDWDGDGVDTPAVRRGAAFHVRDSLSAGPAERVVTYGRVGDVVLVGDWDGDGRDTFAVRRGATYHLRNSISDGPADVVVTYGRADDVVHAGDWDGDGDDTLAVQRGTTFHVKNAIAGGVADVAFPYGRPRDVVLVGDWDGDGRDTVGVRRGNVSYLKNTPTAGPADEVAVYGWASDTAFAGDVDGDGVDTVGVRRPPEHPVWLTGTVTDLSGVVPYSGRYDSRNGRLSPSVLCLVPFMPSHYVHCRARPDLVGFHEAFQARFGERLPIDTWDRSTYRTLAQQQQTYAEIGPPVAARPGTSPHGWGLAVDMYEGPDFDFGSARYRWMLANGPRFGWRNMPWHWETGSVPEYWHFDYVR